MKKRILTGDRPTGSLHLGHYVGSIKNRVKLQDEYECFFLIADLHILTTKNKKEDIAQIKENTRDMVLDYLACGIDPLKSSIYVQSQLYGIYELNLYFQSLVTVPRLNRVPSIKEMAQNAKLSELPYSLLGYPVLQAADILIFRANLVPIGKDNESHLELTREIANRFNHYYGDVFPLPETLLGKQTSLCGLNSVNVKMSKTLNNAILLSDERSILKKKINSMYTDPNRIRADIPGNVENNVVFAFHDVFNENISQIEEMKNRYREGKIKDMEIKDVLLDVLDKLLTPIRDRKKEYKKEKGFVEKILHEGIEKANEEAFKTMKEVRKAMGINYYQNKIKNNL